LLPALEERARELETLQQATGSPGIEQDRPGVFRTLVDLLSRPNYAIAGFTEELLGEEPSVTRGVKRVLAEIFSGVGGIEGDKRAFGETLERLGYGTVTLADAFPALEGTWVGSFGSRGAAGLALDIFTDPLTYLTGGTSAAGRITFKHGGKQVLRHLNKAGLEERARITKEVMNAFKVDDGDVALKRFTKKLFGQTDDFSISRARSRMTSEIDRRTALALADETGDIAKEFIDPGGLKLFGKSILPAEMIRGSFYEPMVAALKSVPGGEQALAGAKWMGDGIRRTTVQVFSPHGPLSHLPAGMREKAIALHRDFTSSSSAHRGRLFNIAKPLEQRYRQLAKKDPGIGKRWYDIREGVRPNDLAGEELELFNETMALYDSMRDTLLAHGVLTPEQIRKGYIYHTYENLEDLQKYHWNTDSPFTGVISEQFTKERAFDTFEEAVEQSVRKNELARRQIQAGTAAREYPVLKPNYDIFQAMGHYINKHSDALARKAWREEVVAQFGKAVDEFDLNALYNVGEPFIDLTSTTAAKIAKWFGPKKNFHALEDEAKLSIKINDPSVIRAGILALDDSEPLTRRIGGRADVSPTATGRDIRKGPTGKTEVDRLRERVAEETAAPPPGDVPVRSPAGPRPIDGGFTGRNRASGRVIAEKIRRGERLTMRERVEAARIVDDQSSTVQALLEQRTPGFTLDTSPRVSSVTREQAQNELLREVRRELKGLDENGKREFIRQLLLRSKSADQLKVIEGGLWDEFSDFFPRRKVQAIVDTDVEPALARTLGEQAAEMIPVKSAWTGNVGVHLPRAVWEDLQGINSRLLNTADYKDFGKIIRGFDWANNRFKLGNYTFWPASLARDIYSNVALSMLDIGIQAMNPRYYRDAIAIMAGRDGTFITQHGIKYSYKSMREMSRDFQVRVPGEVFAELTGDPALTSKGLAKLAKKGTRFRGEIENAARMVLWLANIRRGVDPRRAADHVAEFLFNYGEVSQIEREFFRRLIPFYTFTRKNVELQAKMLRRNPGLQINQLKPFRGRTEENEQMVTWEAEALKLRMDKNGKTVHMLTGIDLPLRNIDTLWRGDFGRTGRTVVGMITPIIKTVPELLLNQDFFLGRDLTRTQSNAVGAAIDYLPTPGPLKDWLGYKKTLDEAGRPRYSFDGRRFTLVFRSWMFSRAVSTADRQFRDNMTNGGVDWQRTTLDFLTGIREKDMDLTEQMERRMRERIRMLEDSLARRGVMGRFSKTFQPKDIGELR
jgi:hypothetical protein